MKRAVWFLLVLLLGCESRSETTESELPHDRDQQLVMGIPNTDPEFAEAAMRSQRSLPVFRKLIAAPEYTVENRALRMVKTRITEGDESAWLWLNVVTDTGLGFDAVVFEAPSELPSLQPGVGRFVSDSEIADWAVNDASETLFGGYSLRLMRSRLPEEERAAYDSYIGVKVYAPLPSE